MKVTAEKLPDSQVELNVEVEPEAVDKAMEKAYRRLVGKVNIPGFRRGKAPRYLVERVLGREALWQEGLEDLVPRVYREAVQETGIKPVDEPQADIVQQEPLVVKFVVPVQPVVELADYRNIRIPKTEVSVSDAEVAAALEQLREQHAEWVPVERPAMVGDQVKADVEGWVGAAPLLYSTTGETLLRSPEAESIISRKDAKIWVSPENRFPVPGFAEQLVGAKAGEVREFRLTLPPDFYQAEYANRSVVFKVTVHEVEEERLPQLDDEFAKKVGDYESFEALRDDLRRQLQAKAEREARQQLENTVVRAVVEQSSVEMPPTFVNREIGRLTDGLTERLQRQNMSLEQYLKVANKTEEQLREELRDDAIRNLKTMLVLDRIAGNENIEVSDEEVDRRIEEVFGRLGEEGAMAIDLLKAPDRRKDIAFEMRINKTIDWLTELATQGPEGMTAETASEGEATGEATTSTGEESASGEGPSEEGPSE